MKFIQRFITIFIMLLSLLFIKKLLQIKNSVSNSKPYDLPRKPNSTSAKLKIRPIVYIKIFKCASSTVAEILFRLSYNYKLDLMVPVQKKMYIGWPHKPNSSYILPPINKFYDVSNSHAIYDRSFFEELMGPGGFYMTSLRNPFKQFKSLVHYYNILNISQVPLSQYRFEDFILHLPYYDNIYKTSESSIRYCVPQFFSMTRNPMSSILNLPFLSGFNAFLKKEDILELTKYNENKDEIIKDFNKISNIDPGTTNQTKDLSPLFEFEKKLLTPAVLQWLDGLKLDFVIFQEHFDESLVLLRRRLYWSFRDILYIPKNIGSYYYKDLKIEEWEELYRGWSWVDHMLYERFHGEFVGLLAKQDDHFHQEVQHFKKVLSQVGEYCASHQDWVIGKEDLNSDQVHTLSLPTPSFVVEASRWNERIEINALICLRQWQRSGDEGGGILKNVSFFC